MQVDIRLSNKILKWSNLDGKRKEITHIVCELSL